MAVHPGADARDVRMQVYSSYEELFSSAPIRLMSRTVSTMRSMGYDDLATAIGDLDWRTVPADDPEDPTLRDEWGVMLDSAFGHVGGWMRQLGPRPMGYNLDSVGYPAVINGWRGMWARQLGLEFVKTSPPEIFVFHGGNQAVQAALLGIQEAHRDRVGAATPCTMLVPIPTFSCPLDQMALQGMHTYLLPPSDPGMDPSATDLEQIPGDVDVDGVYMMPINNPTGRTLPPEELRAFVDAVLDRWPHAGIILDSVYVRMHQDYENLLAWYDTDPRYADSILFVDSLSKTHGVTGLRAGALLSRSKRLTHGALRLAQNVMAGPSNTMQAVVLALLGPFALGDAELAATRIRLQVRMGRHLQRRRRLLLEGAFARWRSLLDLEQPLLPDPTTYDWPGSMYAVLRLSDECRAAAAEQRVSPTVVLYLETGIGGVQLDGFCANPNLTRHGFLVNQGDARLEEFLARSREYVRLSFGMTPPPRV